MCYSSTFPVPMGCNTMVIGDLNTATTTAYTRWTEDGWSRMRLNYSTAGCWDDGMTTSDGSWFDNGDEESAVWWDVSSVYPDTDTGGSVGHEGTDHEGCLPPFDTHAPVIATDIAIRVDACFTDERSNTMTQCHSGFTVEEVQMHEVGHSYGFEHNNAWLTLMNKFTGTNACGGSDGYHPQPWGDEFHGLMDEYGFSNWTSAKDITASHLWGTLSTRTSDSGLRNICTSVSQSNQTFSWTFTNQYGTLTSGFQYRFELRPSAGGAPLWTSGTSSVSGSFTFPGATYQMNSSITIPGTALSLPLGSQYRLWLLLDPNNNISEWHELAGLNPDNWIPFKFTMVEVSGC